MYVHIAALCVCGYKLINPSMSTLASGEAAAGRKGALSVENPGVREGRVGAFCLLRSVHCTSPKYVPVVNISQLK